MNKKYVIIASILIYLIATYFSYDYFSGSVTAQKVTTKTANIDIPINGAEVDQAQLTGPKTEECPINGEMLTKEHKKLWENRRPLTVMIENHTDARPQSGLSSADVIYEAVAEGGITRFLAVFYCKDTRFIGPVRSARMYFIDLASGYGAYPLYAHVGGANTPGKADALGTLNKLGWANFNDLNQFSIAFPTFYRDYERNPGVATEHTMYSSTSKLWKYAEVNRKLTNVDDENNAWDEDFESWKFQDEDVVSNPVTKISYDFWSGKQSYSVVWDYSPETKSYLRSHGDGKPHIDKNTKEQLSSKNVIVAFMKESAANDGYPGGHLLYGTIGQGEALIFQNGEAIEGTWKKPDKESQIRFFDGSGEEIEMVRGQVWVSIVPTGNEVTY
ncbi:hypothetical protein A3H80_03200 [Candidatus Roizmanbacteria bacterium RIFCSPLOWO2_02_FULL_37_19]|uniref:DUF3048 domain-containing protein n=1 Tax=Candidatus Roizmanbacteria bacterium RIFCSPHIGHO2_02_FULL_37_24 TaxID=1802037 RepID=A0A1F7H0M1_9BACT|nr:MAG: hypothetical protein A2862_04290 [Candidatus Roizmanbacteria bacterium RIFCSPHIGHO2_01_FULL_38_41]OGK24708.1 MAG: hypothetical protein A3C24_01125 [Candidatus Roizmanbacteria bacterium RIFCSPHIGHO2_02_FULL_37_24]OGK33227.1 MAG: hypothetical protein A3E10_03725 [Candidatus Roizmanbacteria bacterium RIFCSPHIGHO2_12_FULL_37_23]OGK44099.1 MAG: hypothetical protein A2956_03550 [Candidatus Roizmanbacteria bacterium RIFCSPLOWO2_01_FULL_37_57]OGK54097.1 MAG: hypothetical protein A3H80_03200 [Ca